MLCTPNITHNYKRNTGLQHLNNQTATCSNKDAYKYASKQEEETLQRWSNNLVSNKLSLLVGNQPILRK